MSAEDYFPFGALGEYDDDDDAGSYFRRYYLGRFKLPQPKTCNRCGETDLHWLRWGKWVLADAHDEIHVCHAHPEDDFDVVTD